MGFACLVWMLVRVIPKPSRAGYPCMNVAAPIASGFIAYIVGMALALFSVKRGIRMIQNNRGLLSVAFVLLGVIVGTFTIVRTDSKSYAEILATDSLFVPTDAPNTPIGVARGIFPGRVVWAWDSTAATWSGAAGTYWWNDNNTHQGPVDSMLTKSLLSPDRQDL